MMAARGSGALRGAVAQAMRGERATRQHGRLTRAELAVVLGIVALCVALVGLEVGGRRAAPEPTRLATSSAVTNPPVAADAKHAAKPPPPMITELKSETPTQREASAAPAPNVGAVDRDPSTGPRAGEPDPFLTPGTIYRCKSYQGSVFWSAAHCSRHRALIERIAKVPSTLPFEQQVALARADANRMEATVRSEQEDLQRRVRCTQLVGERERIWKRSGSGAGVVPLDVLGSDQLRWREIRAEMDRLRCGS